MRMNRPLVGLLVTVVGITLAVVSALANQLGIGKQGFGWKQIAGTAVGAALACLGAAVAALRSR
jgi:hypothetical protein